MSKKLYRSNTNKIFAGIFGGLGEYYGVDPTILRLVWILIAVFTGGFAALLIYIIALVIIPLKA